MQITSVDAPSDDHMCSIYQDEIQQYSSVIPFLIDGLISKQKCVYVLSSHTADGISEEMFRRGFPIRPYIDAKQLVFYTKEDTYLSQGYFDADRLISMIRAGIQDGRREGYTKFRASGEMDWAVNGGTTTDKLIAYESQLNAAFVHADVSIFCQYDESRFSSEVLTDIIRTHPKVCVYGKLYANDYFYTPPQWMNLSEHAAARSAYTEMVREITAPH